VLTGKLRTPELQTLELLWTGLLFSPVDVIDHGAKDPLEGARYRQEIRRDEVQRDTQEPPRVRREVRQRGGLG